MSEEKLASIKEIAVALALWYEKLEVL